MNGNFNMLLDFGKRFKRLFTPESIPFIRECVTTKSWWDTVDTVASHFTGAVVYQYPKTGKVMDKWIDDENSNLPCWKQYPILFLIRRAEMDLKRSLYIGLPIQFAGQDSFDE